MSAHVPTLGFFGAPYGLATSAELAVARQIFGPHGLIVPGYAPGFGMVTSVTASGALASSGGATPDITLTDVELLALAGLTSAADKIPYFTGSGTAALLTRDTDGTLAANSDTVIATQKAVKTYVDAHAGSGTVTSVSVVTANGVSGSVATATSTPAITLTLGAITPSSVDATGASSVILNTATTNSPTLVFSIGCNSTGTPVAGFGSSLRFNLESDTTANTDVHEIVPSWVDPTHASRKARVTTYVFDTAAREAFRIEASGSAPMLGVLGASASARLVSPDAGTALVTFGFASGIPTFAGANVTGTVPLATSAGACTGNSATVTVNDAGGDTTCWPMLATSQTGSLAPATDAGLTYNATTNALTATTFIGALTGDVAGNVSGSSGSCTGNAATVTTNANLTGDVTSVGNATTIGAAKVLGSYLSADALLAAGTFTRDVGQRVVDLTSPLVLGVLPVAKGGSTGTNTGDQTSIVGITGTFAQFNTACTDADFARTDAANTFTGHQTIEGVTSTGATGTGKFVFDTAPTLASTVTIGTAGGTTGAALFKGTTSGTVTLTVAAAAGTHTIKLPTADGATGTFLKTDGSGQWSFAAPSVAGSDLTGTSLAAGIVTSSLTSVGTISTGTWAGTTVTADHGGTGRASHTAYSVICGGTTTTAAQQSVASVGTVGQVLGSGGASALPSFVGGLTLLATATVASPVATVNFTLTGWTNANFIAYLVVLDRVVPATDSVEMWLRTSTDGGSTYDAGTSYEYAGNFINAAGTTGSDVATADTKIVIAAGLGNATHENTCGKVWLSNPSAAEHFTATWELGGVNTATVLKSIRGSGRHLVGADIDAIRFLFSSGNISVGEFRLYGVSGV